MFLQLRVTSFWVICVALTIPVDFTPTDRLIDRRKSMTASALTHTHTHTADTKRCYSYVSGTVSNSVFRTCCLSGTHSHWHSPLCLQAFLSDLFLGHSRLEQLKNEGKEQHLIPVWTLSRHVGPVIVTSFPLQPES